MTDVHREVRPGWAESGRLLIESRDLTSAWQPARVEVDRALPPDLIRPFDHVTGVPRSALSRTADPLAWTHCADGSR